MAEMRLQKLLSERGVASRRQAEEWIAAGKVKVNGRVAKLGDKADDRRDIVTVAGKRLAPAAQPLYLMLYKPRGVVTTMKDEQGRKCVAELVADAGARVYPVGRLDRDSEGLLLMTSDGAFANAITHPSAHIPKTYRVTLRGAVSPEQLLPIEEGMLLDDHRTLPAEAYVLVAEPDRTVVEIVLYEGRNRQIRRMCEQLKLEVIRLKRVSIGPLRLGRLPVGKWRALEPAEVRDLLQASQVPQKIAAAYIRGKGGGAHDRHPGGR